MFKNKKGFTLIELLAVIVVLAILALVVTPIVLNIVENAQQGADERSLEQYAKVLMTSYYEEKMKDTSLNLNSFLEVVDMNNTAENVTAVTLSYNGSEVICPSGNEYRFVEEDQETGRMDVVLTHCTVDGREFYQYRDGKASKCVQEEIDGKKEWICK